MKLNTMTKTLVCGVSVMFFLSLGACQIKSAGVRVETDTELKAKVSRAIKRYMQENGDAPRSFDLLKGKYLDEKTYELALESNMKYTYIGKRTFLLSPGARQIKSEDVRVETDTELRAKISKAIRKYRQENGDTPRSFDLLKGKYLDEKTYKWALSRNIKYTYIDKSSYRYSMSPKPRGGPPAHAPAHGYRAKHPDPDFKLKAKISKAIRKYMRENGDAPRSFDLLKGKYLDEKTYKWALAKNMKYTYVGNKSYRFSMPSKPKSGPPAHAPAHGYRAKHRYRYYPSCYVYFDVSRKCYFYLARAGWKVSASLPVHMRAQLGDYVSIEMDTDRPYTKFQEHKKKYPPRRL